MHKLILASESPRRKKLLEDAGFSFRIFSVKVSEILEKNLTIDQQILNIAHKKAEAAFEMYNPLESQSYLILSADTMVVVNDQPLGKPNNPQEAEKFLGLLSGKKHFVKTGLNIIEGYFDKKQKFKISTAQTIDTTEVEFRPILRHEILDYIKTGEPMDKAGAYAIQGLGSAFVKNVSGAYDNVVGLPISKLQELLIKNKWKVK